MQGALEEFLTGGVFVFMLTFMRIGTAAMVMPGIGDSYVNTRVRLHIALALSFILMPVIMPYAPSPLPKLITLVSMVVVEMIVGLLMGMVARIFVIALDTAGMVVSSQSGLANAQIFNPTESTQGSLVGSMLTMTGAILIYATNLHHLLITGFVESYQMFPMGEMPDTGSMAELVSKAVTTSFNVGVKLASPFIVMTLLMYVGMGALSRLMPQVQVFMIVLPLQILLAIMLLAIVFAAMFTAWLGHYQSALLFFFSGSPG